MDHTRDPCPWVALNDFGGAFCMGVCNRTFSFILPEDEWWTPQNQSAKVIRKECWQHFSQAIGGAVWHGVKGFRNSPYGERRIGALTAIKARAPVLGGNFGVWGGLFSTFDCAVKGLRKKEDPYNASMLLSYNFRLEYTCWWICLAGQNYGRKDWHKNSHCRILYWWCFGNPWWCKSSKKLGDRLCGSFGCHWRCWNWFPKNDGGQYKIRGMDFLPHIPPFRKLTFNSYHLHLPHHPSLVKLVSQLSHNPFILPRNEYNTLSWSTSPTKLHKLYSFRPAKRRRWSHVFSNFIISCMTFALHTGLVRIARLVYVYLDLTSWIDPRIEEDQGHQA